MINVDWRTENDFVVFDLEIKKMIDDLPNGWKDTHLMGISSAVAWDNLQRRFCIFDDHNMNDLVRRLTETKLVVGFNHIRFDYRVFTSPSSLIPKRPVIESKEYLKDNEWPLIRFGEEFDILLEVWKTLHKEPVFTAKTHMGFGLGQIAMDTLGLEEGKIGHGANAPKLYKEGRWAELIDYNQQDVKLTRDLFLFARRHGYVMTKEGQAYFDLEE